MPCAKPEAWNYDPKTGGPGVLTVNGELYKLAHNVSFGRGLHGSIHWRSDTDSSILLGEAIAVSFLENLACTCAEPFSLTFTEIDRTPQTSFSLERFSCYCALDSRSECRFS